jgi:nucleotide-binding universal stress UspA family protein
MLATKQAKQRVTFENILLATDFLPAANAAMSYAAGLARSFGANLYALHVTEPTNYALPPEMPPQICAGMQTAVEAGKQGLREKLHRDFPGVTPKIIEAEGLAEDMVLVDCHDFGHFTCGYSPTPDSR